ncbi:MAG: glutaredoxin domain-containing protein [Nitrospira sp.]
MAHVTIYQKPTCTTCRQAVQLLKNSGKPYTAINYYEQPFTKGQLQSVLKKPDSPLGRCFTNSTKEEIYYEQPFKKGSYRAY